MSRLITRSTLAAAMFALPFSGAALAQGTAADDAPTPTPAPAAEQENVSPSGNSADNGASADPMTVDMASPDGESLGSVEVTSTPLGLLFKADLSGLSSGTHAFHIHETGTCEGDFSSAGGHYNPGDNQHGFLAENGPHAGDMTNFVVADGGSAQFEEFNAMVTLDGAEAPLNDADGSALLVHDGADDYLSQPSGDAGDRIACGVIFAAQ